MQDEEYFQPVNCTELAAILQEPGRKIIAGGTDLIPRMRRGIIQSGCLIDISRVMELQSIRLENQSIRIGSLTTHAKIASSALLQQNAPVLVDACTSIGCRQTRYRGTLGGNLANASPAADTAPALLVLDANIRITSASGARTIPLDRFFVSPGITSLAGNEFIESVQVGQPGKGWGESFLKLGKRNGMAIAIASAAVHLELDEKGFMKGVRVAVGSLAPRPVRCRNVELLLEGEPPSEEIIKQAGEEIKKDISPIDDIRASKAYRLHAIRILIQRALDMAVKDAQGRNQ